MRSRRNDTVNRFGTCQIGRVHPHSSYRTHHAALHPAYSRYSFLVPALHSCHSWYDSWCSWQLMIVHSWCSWTVQLAQADSPSWTDNFIREKIKYKMTIGKYLGGQVYTLRLSKPNMKREELWTNLNKTQLDLRLTSSSE